MEYYISISIVLRYIYDFMNLYTILEASLLEHTIYCLFSHESNEEGPDSIIR